MTLENYFNSGCDGVRDSNWSDGWQSQFPAGDKSQPIAGASFSATG